MTQYLPIIISAIIIFTALMWWLLALGSVTKSSASTEVAREEPKVAPPEVLPEPVTVPPAQLMDDPAPTPITAPPKAQTPLKAAATKAAPTKAKAPATPRIAADAPAAATEKMAPAPKSVPDNLLLLKGVGPKVNAMLKDMGITSFEQVANWTQADIAEIDAKLGAFAGRISRDNWVDQARLLAAGDTAGFEKKYGALGSAAKGSA